jgi:hypothetical protein
MPGPGDGFPPIVTTGSGTPTGHLHACLTRWSNSASSNGGFNRSSLTAAPYSWSCSSVKPSPRFRPNKLIMWQFRWSTMSVPSSIQAALGLPSLPFGTAFLTVLTHSGAGTIGISNRTL